MNPLRIAMLGPVAWRTPPRHYGPWEQIVSSITETLVSKGHDVTLFATGDSLTKAKLESIIKTGYEEDRSINAKVVECLHIANCFEKASEFDIIHNHFDFLPLTYCKLISTPVITTIHGFSSPSIIPVYKRYNDIVHYVSISNADRSNELLYKRTIYHGIDLNLFSFNAFPDDYLVFMGRMHPDKGAADAIRIAELTNKHLVMAGIIQDQSYFDTCVAPHIDNDRIQFIGSVTPSKRNELLGSASALLHPISFNEPFGLTVIEAMACGTPVIAYDRGSMPELITQGIDGFLVNSVTDAADSVLKIRRIERQACRLKVERRFTTERMVSEYIDLYEEILKRD